MKIAQTGAVAFCLLCFCAAILFFSSCHRNDDEEDEASTNNDGLPFYCGKDMDCHDDYLDCVVECDTWQCVENQCNDNYLLCLSDDGCTQIHLICKDNCGGDQSCLWECDDDLVDCMVAYCNWDANCAGACITEYHGCQTDCGTDISCQVTCVWQEWDCLEDCLP